MELSGGRGLCAVGLQSDEIRPEKVECGSGLPPMQLGNAIEGCCLGESSRGSCGSRLGRKGAPMNMGFSHNAET